MTSRSLPSALGLCAALWLAGCGDDATEPSLSRPETRTAAAVTPEMAAEVRQLAGAAGITALQRPAPVRPELSELGRLLAFDKVLSGNRDISCMTCHLTKFGTTDARSVAIGQGAAGLGPDRVHPQGKFVHRNAPPLFNLHAMSSLTWDGRVFVDAKGSIRMPSANLLSKQRAVLECGVLSAQTMLPVLSRSEMRADAGNELAAIPDSLHQRVWKFLMRRLATIPEYRTRFEAAYQGQSFDQMTFAHAGNAMGCWIANVFAFTNTPWDRFLNGRDDALTEAQLRGARLFLTTGRCAQCHNGPALSDGKFHNVLVPQVGPGFGNGPDGHDDFGRFRQTSNPKHKYAFRTPPLRNVELTAPYGHDGAITTLRAWVDHYSQAGAKLTSYDPSQLEPLLRGTLQPNADSILATRDRALRDLVLTPAEVDDLTEFLKALTDNAARNLSAFAPAAVPSGLPVDVAP
ncbi:MAG TPA: cytochrome c peroxidase [Gemmatimonadales bacterium]|nr:cytochrome c peroxidase [Gemmatimonadales bacterium]